jgi:hypothetical protein
MGGSSVEIYKGSAAIFGLLKRQSQKDAFSLRNFFSNFISSLGCISPSVQPPRRTEWGVLHVVLGSLAGL